MTSLKSFIKSVRGAKTIAQERSIIQRESAAIRTSFREDYTDSSIRRENIAKLLYLFTLGERTHFGQVECLKLLPSPHFIDKRLGYLGTMLLLDENQEVLTLLTNSLNNDLNSNNQYIVGLALCTLGNIASPELATDLYNDVDKLLSSPNPYLKKKAAVCAMKIISKVPDLVEIFADKAKLLLQERNHGVLLCALYLVQEICRVEPGQIQEFLVYFPVLVKHLKALISSGYSPEHDVVGITDPFLQVELLQTMRLLLEDLTVDETNAVEGKDNLNDLLAQIASNTDSSKNVGNAVLYETVRTIFGIKTSDSGLKVLGINILGKFLSNKDNNTRYVALNTLLSVVEYEPLAVQRHRNTIIGCLDDSDVSIRRRALELAFGIINDQNIRVLTRELLNFLERADSEFKPFITTQIAIAAETYSPNIRWHFDTLLRMLKLAGSYVNDDVVSDFLRLLMKTNDQAMRQYVVQKLYAAVQDDVSQESLTLVSLWSIGEYGELILRDGGNVFKDGDDKEFHVTEERVVNLLETLMLNQYSSDNVVMYCLNALIKLSIIIQDPKQLETVRKLISTKSKDVNVEVQQRVSEYSSLFTQSLQLKRGILEKMPPPTKASLAASTLMKSNESHSAPAKSQSDAKTASKPSEQLLLDLLGGAPETAKDEASNNKPVANSMDLLSDLLGDSSISQNSTSQNSTPNATSASAKSDILDLFGNNGSAPAAAAAAKSATAQLSGDVSSSASQKQYQAYKNNYFSIAFTITDHSTPGTIQISTVMTSLTSTNISNINIQVAVPKTQKLVLYPISSSTLGGSNVSVTQSMKITGPPGANVKLRVRLSYDVAGKTEHEMFDFNKFPPGLL